MNHTRHLPAFCSLLLLAGPAAALAQAPLLPPTARRASLGEVAQAAPIAPPPAAASPAAGPATPADTTPAPLDPNAPAPIAPPPAINGQPAAGAVPPPPAVDAAAPAGGVNAGGARAREFQGDDVGQVLRLLSRQAKINMVVSPQVVGTINMRLEDVTALQAIEVICQAQGYDMTQTNGVYYVKTPAEKAAEPTQSDFYTFSYARAATVLPLLVGQMKSKGGTPQVDERTNTVFYQEAKSNLSTIREFLNRVDKPTRQVMIEARLVEVNSNPTQSYGINWGGVFGSAASPKTFKYGGALPDGRVHDVRADGDQPRHGGADHHPASSRATLPTGHHGCDRRCRSLLDFTAQRPDQRRVLRRARRPVRHPRRSLSSPRPCASSTRTRTRSSSPTRASSRRTTWRRRSRSCATSPCRSSTSTSKRPRRCSAASRTSSTATRWS